jgi:hypothetical protein
MTDATADFFNELAERRHEPAPRMFDVSASTCLGPDREQAAAATPGSRARLAG